MGKMKAAHSARIYWYKTSEYKPKPRVPSYGSIVLGLYYSVHELPQESEFDIADTQDMYKRKIQKHLVCYLGNDGGREVWFNMETHEEISEPDYWARFTLSVYPDIPLPEGFDESKYKNT